MKKIMLYTLGTCLGLFALAYSYVQQLELENFPQPRPDIKPLDLPYVNRQLDEDRGRILIVVSSTADIDGKKSLGGYELTEVSRAYFVFKVNGFEVDFASPQGGEPPATIDDLMDFDYAFVNDQEAQTKINNSIPLDSVNGELYKAVYFAGGKGAMSDFAHQPAIENLVQKVYEGNSGVIAAVCHGPAALLGVKLSDGQLLLSDKTVTSFSNDEELLLIGDAKERFGFLLQSALESQGAEFSQTAVYTENIVLDGRLITGQNPWSTWAVAEAMVKTLGFTPVVRERTLEEKSIDVVGVYYKQGYQGTLEYLEQPRDYSRPMIALYGVVAMMELRLWDGVKLLRIAVV